MALSPYGPHGPLIGKVGKLVSYVLKGRVVTRSLGPKRTKHSKKQLANYQAMAVTMRLLSNMTTFINSSFEIEARGTFKNQHNLATSYNKKQALKGEYPNISVDYSKVVLSYGRLKVAENLKMVKTGTGLQISWDTRGGQVNDMAMILVHHPVDAESGDHLNACRRDAGTHFIPLDEERLKQQLEVYICFKSADGKQISNSVYLGNLNGETDSPEVQKEKEKYVVLKKRFDQVSAEYFRMMELRLTASIDNKAFRTLEKEYKVLAEKLKYMPGKPG
ncbi:DUF6266 family protein [Pedobacter caeni]|uniref:Uncharacterized protein n=1 Tax=Pedobacter caeni TaxID=288992 RepID=A0A1M5GHE4_9SPHI|nr:DUF6266 family protein [Pedobacter caeni]SHG03108.1 hypothetical protein SAMN04488522_104220 [Pedobacter caeni]